MSKPAPAEYKLALGFQAMEWLAHHADTAISSILANRADRCPPCCRYAAALLRGEDPEQAEELRCSGSRRRLAQVREAQAIAEEVLRP